MLTPLGAFKLIISERDRINRSEFSLYFIYSMFFNIILLVYSIKAFKSNSIFQIFLGLFYLHTFLAIFSSGRPLDFTYWIAFLVYIRFLGIENNELNIS